MRAIAGAIVAVTAVAAIASEEEAVRFHPAVRTVRVAGGTQVDGLVPGRLLGFAFPTTESGRREVALLVSPQRPPDDSETEPASPSGSAEGAVKKLPPCNGPSSDGGRLELYRMELDGRSEMSLLRDDLAESCDAIHAVDLDGDSRDEIVVACDDRLLAGPWGERGDGTGGIELQPVVATEESVWRFLRPGETSASRASDPVLVGAVRLGAFDLYGPGQNDVWDPVAEIELPVEGSVRGGNLRIGSEIPDYLGRGADGALTFVTGPTPVGRRRLRTLLLETVPGGATHVTECWSSLPEDEDVLESDHFLLDGKPVLYVTTKPADKLSLFGEKRVRIFELRRDRSRLGSPPSFAVESRMNLWQESVPMMHDVNGDSRKDLVLGYWKGLKDDRVVLDAYLRTGDGNFEDKARTTAFDVPDGDRDVLLYGEDLDGDGVADLLIRSGRELVLHPGLRSSNGKRLVSEEPRVIGGGFGDAARAQVTYRGPGEFEDFDPGPVEGRPRLVDLDADGTPEIVVARRGGASRPGVLRIVWLRPVP